MKINAEAAHAWLKGKLKVGCVSCGSNNWDVNDTAFKYEEYLPAAPVGPIGARHEFPVFLIECESCGFVMTFGAVKAGLVK